MSAIIECFICGIYFIHIVPRNSVEYIPDIDFLFKFYIIGSYFFLYQEDSFALSF